MIKGTAFRPSTEDSIELRDFKGKKEVGSRIGTHIEKQPSESILVTSQLKYSLKVLQPSEQPIE